MASKGDIEREKKVAKLVDKFAAKRQELKEKRDNLDLSVKERIMAALELDGLPKNTAKIRKRNRCSITGYPRSYFRAFGVSRHSLRELIAFAEIPGVGHATW